MVDALCKELVLRKGELPGEVQTIYFGGGTPSLLNGAELEQIFKTIRSNYNISEDPEITLEANPDDMSEELMEELANSSINRLSIGVQSFFEEDLKLMNRAHNANEATDCIKTARKYFDNLSIDLIYGIPKMSNERWLQNLQIALELDIPHISCYALTVEPKTALKNFIEKGIIPPVEDEVAQEHHKLLVEMTNEAGFDNYEFSNFGKPGFYSKNNMAYWQGKPYLGIGPSAHSYDGNRRTWNVANNAKYMKEITLGELPLERETLSNKDKYNEYVMTRLRTMWGVSLDEVENTFGKKYLEYLLQQADEHLCENRLILEKDHLKVTSEGKFLSDGIASDLFLIELGS